MSIDIPQTRQSHIKRLTRVAVAVWIASLVIASMTDLVWQRYGGPAWIGPVLVRFFQALALLAMGAFVFGVVYAPPANFQPGKTLKIMGIIFGAITVLLGLWGLWGAGANLLALMQ